MFGFGVWVPGDVVEAVLVLVLLSVSELPPVVVLPVVSVAPVLPEVRCPVLAIHGSEDEYGSSAHPEQIGALSGGPARVEIMAETRHMPHREREDEVVGLVAEFIRPLA